MANYAPARSTRFTFLEFFLIGLVTLITFAPVLRSGFRLVDDYSNIHRAGTVPLIQYLVDAGDPRVQYVNYRPVGIYLLLIAYNIFHADATLYHLMQIAIHLLNSILVFAIALRFFRKWSTASLAAVIFAGFPIAVEAVFWISEQSPIATLFSLTALLFWVRYLQQRNLYDYVLGIGSLVLTLLSRESAMVVPALFVCIDCLIVRKEISLNALVRRYSVIGLIMLVYLGIEYNIQRNGLYVTAGGYSFGEHVISNYSTYLAMLSFPWAWNGILADGAIWIFVAPFTIFALLRRKTVLLCLILMTVVSIGPVVLAPLGVGSRYLYFATAPMSILMAIGLNSLRSPLNSQGFKLALPALVACLVILNSSMIANAAVEYTEDLRQSRVPFRDILRRHPTLPSDTRVFLIDPPVYPLTDIAGMFFLQYGSTVSVWGSYQDGAPYTFGTLRSQPANLSKYNTAYVYYFDEAKRPVEVLVDKGIQIGSNPELPKVFQVPIRLEGYELTSTTLELNKPLVLILYWRALDRIDRDYTVFIHLVDSNGTIIDGVDELPRSGKERTSSWRTDRFTVDAHIIPVPVGLSPGKSFNLELGLYHLPTLERLSILGDNGAPLSDRFIIGPFTAK